ncbi:endo alpha-1,4 polygalactosaminidase [Trinickia dabaoshanensis]|uniref:Endo alpha-1,4 polygalactosaminidase n=1 Tax=Trinickia dabaoshanensis TaxID=564714 RepID=A0A2N7VCU7_9BURK|nr:endo alpha-1,4 polygalactosaminidase [Trinickia dabaoshanensis]PMS14988.1 endo alpha-1,4 polygalactosaminidase [Trinickia dabaoshanensis]
MKIARTLCGAAAAVLCATVLQACGGGSSNSPAARAVSASQQPNTATRWTPVASDTWQWQLQGKIKTSYDVKIYDIDLFNTDTATIQSLHNAGRKVVCYFSAGSSENWRPDYNQFKSTDIGNPLDPEWVGENWLDIRSDNVRSIMKQRLDLAVSKGCDGVEPDNVDGYANDPGFPLTAQDQIDYNTFLANEAHSRNLAVALKNDTDQLAQLEPLFDFALNEECNERNECDYGVFTSDNKLVLNAEYAAKYHTASEQSALCAAAHAANMRTLVLAKKLDDSYRFSCDAS